MQESWEEIKARVDIENFQKDIDALIKKYRRDVDTEIARGYVVDKIKQRDFYREEGKKLVGSFNYRNFRKGVEYLWKGNLVDFSLFHMDIHGAYARFPNTDFDPLIPNSREQWVTCHNLRHHRFTNFADLDADYKIFGKYIRANKHIKWQKAHAFQVLEAVAAVFFFRTSFPLHYSNVPDHGYKKSPVDDPLVFITPDVENRKLFDDIKAALSGVPKWIRNEYITPIKKANFRALNTALGLMISDLITNVLLYTILVPAHHFDEVLRFENHEKPASKGEWYLMQILTSCSFTDLDDSFFAEMLPDFVYHISHHLFPATPECFYKAMMEETKAICRKHNVPYPEKELKRESLNHFKNLVRYSLPIDNVSAA